MKQGISTLRDYFFACFFKFTSQASIIQQMFLCSTHKYASEIHTLLHLKVSILEHTGNVRWGRIGAVSSDEVWRLPQPQLICWWWKSCSVGDGLWTTIPHSLKMLAFWINLFLFPSNFSSWSLAYKSQAARSLTSPLSSFYTLRQWTLLSTEKNKYRWHLIFLKCSNTDIFWLLSRTTHFLITFPGDWSLSLHLPYHGWNQHLLNDDYVIDPSEMISFYLLETYKIAILEKLCLSHWNEILINKWCY